MKTNNPDWIHAIINRKGEAAFYDLYGAEVVKALHEIYKENYKERARALILSAAKNEIPHFFTTF